MSNSESKSKGKAMLPPKGYQHDGFDVLYDNGEDLILMENHVIESQSQDLNGHNVDKREVWNEVLFCVEGEMWCELNGSVVHMEKNSILIVPSYFVIEKCEMSSDAKILNICFSSRVSLKFVYNDMTPWNRMVYQRKDNYLVMSECDMAGVCDIWKILTLKIKRRMDKYDEQIIYMNVGIILCKVMRYMERREQDYIPTMVRGRYSSKGEQLFNQFLEVLAKTTPKRHVIGYYANQLSITSNYLSVICTKYSNKSVMKWIQEAVLEEVRYYLLQFNLSVQEVAMRTGFENLSFFTRYVKKHFGCTPTEFRRQHARYKTESKH